MPDFGPFDPNDPDLLARARLTRRYLLAGSAALVGASTLTPLLGLQEAHAQAPQRGGTLRAGLSGAATNDTLDPTSAACCGTNLSSVNYMIRNTLVETDDRYRPTRASRRAGKLTGGAGQWTFKLRSGVEFHNGKPFEAADAIFSLDVHRKNEASPAAVLLKEIKEIKSPDAHTLVFELAAPNADFPAVLADYHLQVAPADTKDWNDGIGTGPFKLVEHEPGVRASTVRNEKYWRQGMPYFDAVECTFINDVTARTNALIASKLDIIDKPDLATVHLLERNPKIQVVRVGSTRHYNMPMRVDVPPFENNDVRLALKYALPRAEILDKVAHGYGSLGNDQPISPLQRYFADLPQRPFDLDKAKFYYQKAGSPVLPPLSTSDVAFPGAVDAALLLQNAAAQAGIKIDVVREPERRLLVKRLAEGAVSACPTGPAGRPRTGCSPPVTRAPPLERSALEKRALQQAPARGAQRTRRRQAPGGVRGDAAHRP